MSRAQRLTFLAIALVIAVVAVIVLTAGGDDEPEPTGATGTPTATATAAPDEDATATPTPSATKPPHRPGPPTLTQGKVTNLRFSEGDIVRFRVRADIADEVHVHGYDLMKDVEPGVPVTFSFAATITGIFEIELEDAGEQIGQLRVDP